MHDLQNTVHRLPQTDLMLSQTIEDVTNRLIASSFYFKKIKIDRNPHGFLLSGKSIKRFMLYCTETLAGSLHSKFESTPVYVEQVARFLKHQILKDFVPKFVFTQHLNSSSEKHKVCSQG